MPITFNRVSRSYRLVVKSTDENKILEVASLAEKLGLDVIIEEEVEGFKKPPAPRIESINYVYGIWRDKILGYIGYTKDPDRRLKEHADKLEFANWLSDGIERQDLTTAVSDGYPLSEARNLEKRLVRKFSPPFNVNEKRILSIDLNGASLLKMLEE